MKTPIRCSLINYDEGIHAMISHYISRAGCQEAPLATGVPSSQEGYNLADKADLIFLHLALPEETVQDDLARHLKQHRGLVITSPFPKQQFHDLFTQPFAFLTEPFSFAQFSKCLDMYQRTN